MSESNVVPRNYDPHAISRALQVHQHSLDKATAVCELLLFKVSDGISGGDMPSDDDIHCALLLIAEQLRTVVSLADNVELERQGREMLDKEAANG